MATSPKLAQRLVQQTVTTLSQPFSAKHLPLPVIGDWLVPFSQLAIANTLSNLMVPLAGLIDTAFLGHLSDIRYLNGVALATVIFNVIYWSFNFFRMGTTGPTAQALGKGDLDEVWLIVVRNSLLALGTGLAVWLLRSPISTAGFALLQTGPDVRLAAMDFYNGRIVGAPAVLLNYVLLGWLLGRSKGKQVVVLAVVGNGSNIVLDYWFIRQLGLESYGAGFATALSQYIMLAMGIGLVISDGIPWERWAAIKTRLWQPAALMSVFNLNRDILVRTFALVIAMSLFTNFSSGLGDTILGVNALLIQVVLMSAYFMDGIALAVESYAGQFYGNQSKGDLYGLLLLGIGGSVVLGSAIALFLIFVPTAFFPLLTNHAILLDTISDYIIWLLPVLSFGGVAFTLDGYFLGLTNGRVLRNSTLIAALIGFLPLAVIARYLALPHLLWLALAALMVTRALTLLRKVPATVSTG
ncbi:MAG: MATE family efflux transporter [Leptolyngbya foveolarum]|uniref:MATE family efflux transporter n=1 Tax=Leptolyngbya foveolarum TaxID=47253 RepID=A0A2W4UN56_9CYAN|nr:MAG: MATE family efflux transporter [Leptolyngbya foveolarum]